MSDDKVVELRASHLGSPEEIFEAAKDQWRKLTADLAADHLTREDTPWLAEYALTAVLSTMAWQEMNSGGILPNGRTSPWVEVQNHESAKLLMLSSRLGLSPRGRYYREKKAALLAATPPFEKGLLMARFDAIEKRLAEHDAALQIMEGLHASIEATRTELEQLVCELLGETPA
jgi:phage terminase small subunit